MKFDIWVFLENLFRKFKFHRNLTRITGTFCEDKCTFMIISRTVILRMRYVSGKRCREKRAFLGSITFFFFDKSAFYEIMWKNIVQPGGPQMTIFHAAYLRLQTHLQNM